MNASDMDDFADAINDPQLDMQVGAAEDGRALSEDEWAAIERFREGKPLRTSSGDVLMSGGEFAAIEARLAAATPGPWTVERWEDFAGKQSYYVDGVLRWREHLNTLSCEGDKDTAEFIAHAREDVPALLAAVRERDNTIARVREVLREVSEETPAHMSSWHFTMKLRAALGETS